MPTLALEGTGATIAFATSGLSADLIALTLPERGKEGLATTHLGTTIANTARGARLVEPGQIVVEFDEHPGMTSLVRRPPEEVTITYPLRTGLSTPDRLRFTAFAISESAGEFTVGQRITRSVSLAVMGDLTFLAGDPPITNAPISPILEVVYREADGSYTAVWGYLSRNTVPVVVPVGSLNRFSPSPADRGQPTTFTPGRQVRVFEVPFAGTLVWSLKGRTGTAGTGGAIPR